MSDNIKDRPVPTYVVGSGKRNVTRERFDAERIGPIREYLRENFDLDRRFAECRVIQEAEDAALRLIAIEIRESKDEEVHEMMTKAQTDLESGLRKLMNNEDLIE